MLFLSLIIGLASCSDDDNQANNNNSQASLNSIIEGEWELTSLEQKNGENKVNGDVINTFTGSGSDFQGSIIFNADGTLRSEIAYTMTQVMNVSGTSQTITTDIPQTVANGTYKVLSNTQIESTSAIGGRSGSKIVADVSGLSPTTMTWEAKIADTNT